MRQASPLRQIREALAGRLVLLDAPVRDAEEAFRAAVDRCVSEGAIPEARREQVARELIAREQQASTALEHGVAVPHAFVEGLERRILVFVRPATPFDMGAPDDSQARFLFILIGPPEQAAEHLAQLTAIARLMSDDTARFDLGQARSSDELAAAVERFGARTSPEARKAPELSPGLVYTGKLGGGLLGDIRRRWASYRSDFVDGLHPKTVSSTLFLFFACLAPSVTFGGLMHEGTGGLIGATEMLVATALCGVVQALFGGQPLIILGGTGPLLVLTGVLYSLCGRLGLQAHFLATYAWVGLWTSVFCVALALLEAAALIRYFTRFTDEIFAALISLIFIVEAGYQIFDYVRDAHATQISHDVGFLSLILASGTFILAMNLSRMRSSRYLRPIGRELLSDFGPTIAVGLMMLFAHIFSAVRPEPLAVPSAFGTTTGRPWLVDILAAPRWIWFASAGPALVVTVLVYMDQNITARIVNSPDNRLRKGEAYHLDTAVVGVLIGVCSMLGLPWLVAATVRSLNHVRSLATSEDATQAGGETRSRIVHVRETRLTGLLIHLMIGASLLFLPYLQQVPRPVLYGLFLYMGVVSIAGNQFFERVMLWVMDPALYPRTHYIRLVPLRVVHAFTALQVACLVILWVVKMSVAGILFPLFIALLVPVRVAANRLFRPGHLEALDAESVPKEEETEWV
jgi:mannitol/fructose-specific phosphotransferase system IIA component (Ntr-type)